MKLALSLREHPWNDRRALVRTALLAVALLTVHGCGGSSPSGHTPTRLQPIHTDPESAVTADQHLDDEDATLHPGSDATDMVLTHASPSRISLEQSTDDVDSAMIEQHSERGADEPTVPGTEAEDALDVAETEDDADSPAPRAGRVVRILSGLSVSEAQLNVQQSPIDVRDGIVYTANIEPGPDGDGKERLQKTVLRQGQRDEEGAWQWKSAVVDEATLHDPWHTAPSVALDRDSHVHVVYNMHNTPWQYRRSARPHDIASLDFHGQALSEAETERRIEDNRTTFRTLGRADIPGNQITYPAFYRDHDDELFVTYRQAVRPRRPFDQRAMGAGIARYDTNARSWKPLGAAVGLDPSVDFESHPDAPEYATTVAAKRGWTVYHPRLTFDSGNVMHVQLFWRQGVAGAELRRPCFFVLREDSEHAHTIRGESLELPVQPEDCGNIGYSDEERFVSLGSVAMNSEGKQHILLSPYDGVRQIVSYDKNADRWERFESPYNAVEIFFDADDSLWAISNGMTVSRRRHDDDVWEIVYAEDDAESCFPKAVLDEERSMAYVHTHACDGQSVDLFAVHLK